MNLRGTLVYKKKHRSRKTNIIITFRTKLVENKNTKIDEKICFVELLVFL